MSLALSFGTDRLSAHNKKHSSSFVALLSSSSRHPLTPATLSISTSTTSTTMRPPYFILKVIAVILRWLLPKVYPQKQAQPDTTMTIVSRSGDRQIHVNVYYPAEHDPANPQPNPVLINFCGSGFVIPGHGIDDEFCRFIANNANHTVLDVEYRLAPEYPYPAALDDAIEVIEYVKTKPDEYNVRHISLSGFSAGANIAVSTAMNSYGRNDFYAVIAFYPPVDATIDPKEKEAPVPIPLRRGGSHPPCLLRFFQDCYLYPDTDPAHPRVSPLYAPADSFPFNTLWITAEHDRLCPEAERLSAKGRRDLNCAVNWRRANKCGHAWDKFAKEGTCQNQEKLRAYGMARDILTRTHPRPSTPEPRPSTAEAGPSGARTPPPRRVRGEEFAGGSVVTIAGLMYRGAEIPTEPPEGRPPRLPVPMVPFQSFDLTTWGHMPSPGYGGPT